MTHRATHQSHPGFLQPHMAPCRAETSFDSSAPQSHGDVSSPTDVQECVGVGKDCHSLHWYCYFTCLVKYLWLVDLSQTRESDIGPFSPVLWLMPSSTSCFTGTGHVYMALSVFFGIFQLSTGNTEASISHMPDMVIINFLQQLQTSA